MLRKIVIRPERLVLREPFRISRGLKTFTDVVVVELHDGDIVGRGECVPYPRYGETVASVAAQLQPLAKLVAAGEPFERLADRLPPGAARNAVDCAAWDFHAARAETPVAERIGRAATGILASAVTISLDTVGNMRAAAARVANAPVIKVKLDAEISHERLAAVAEAAPGAQLIVDPNESWTGEILAGMANLVSRLPVILVEQPLPSEDDEALRDLEFPAPICADESVHTRADLDGLLGKYDVINIKLDKAGGLTEGLALLDQARAMNFGVMTGCMICSSLSIAPALLIAAQSDVVDLDGPWWLAQDRAGGCGFEGGLLIPPAPGFWGEPGATSAWARAATSATVAAPTGDVMS